METPPALRLGLCAQGQMPPPPGASVSSSGPVSWGHHCRKGEGEQAAARDGPALGLSPTGGVGSVLTDLAGRGHFQTLLVCPDATFGAEVTLVESTPAPGEGRRRGEPQPTWPFAIPSSQPSPRAPRTPAQTHSLVPALPLDGPAWLCSACDGPPGTSPPRWIPGTAGQPGPHRPATPPGLWGPAQRWPRGAGHCECRTGQPQAPSAAGSGQGRAPT